MNNNELIKLTSKYSSKEISTAAQLMVDILATQSSDDEEFSRSETLRLQKQLDSHISGRTEYLSLNQVKDGLGI